MRSWLRNRRKQKKLTQAETAQLMGISRQQYNFIESGARQADLSLSTAVKLCDIFGLSLDEIKKNEDKLHEGEQRGA